MRRRELLLNLAALLLSAPALGAASGGPLGAAVAAARRSPAARARDVWRHPVQVLDFWGLAPRMTVVEIEPAGGYWTEILAPYARATGGRYVAALGGGPTAVDAFRGKFADQSLWGPIEIAQFSAVSGPLVPPGTADLVFTARNIHDWLRTAGFFEKALADFHAALAPGKVLGVEEHRADPRPMKPGAPDGYVSTAFVVAAAKTAGFRLGGASEVNANPADTKDHPFGVWTLPPTLRSHAAGQPTPPGFDPARYAAIGESDRMTLRFIRG